ncbi:MAG: hypothetical protein ACP5QT_05325 [Brevinematia bacterium]
MFYLTFLAGFVLIRLLKYESSVLRELLVSFGLSLFINYTFTYILAITNLISSLSYFIFSFFLSILLVIALIKEKERISKDLFLISLAIFALIFLWLLNQFVAKSGSIPWGADDLFGWNGWAMNWYLKKPVFSQGSFYPQMLPITWAISYFFSESEKIFFFSRSIMPYFFFGIILFGIDNFWQKKKTVVSFFGALSLLWLFLVWREYPRMTQGLADIPSAFFAFSSFMLLLETIEKDKDKTLPYGISILLATASALTKQYGVVYYAGFFIIMLIFIVKYSYNKRENTNLKKLSLFILISVILLSSWYIYGFFVNKYHTNTEAMISIGPFADYKYNITRSKNILESFFHSINLLSGYFKSPLILLIVFLLSLLGIFIWPFSLVFILIILPAYLLWALLIAYSIRNFSIGLLFLIFQSGVGISFIWEKLKIKLENNFFQNFSDKFLQIYKILLKYSSLLLIVAISIVLAFNFIFTEEKLSKKQNERMKLYLGDHRDVNAMLYNYLKSNPEAIVYTDYPFIRYFPEIKYIENSLTNLQNLKETIKTNSNIVFLIITGLSKSHISKDCEDFISTNKIFKKVDNSQNGYLIELKY